jgi:hypothetical protein
LFACIERPEASISFVDQQRDLFNEKKVEAEAARRLLVSARKQEIRNENQRDNTIEVKLDVPNDIVEEMDRNKEKEAHSDEARLEVQNELDVKMDEENQEESSEEARLDVQSFVEEMDRIEVAEEESKSERSKLEILNKVEEGMDDDVSRKDSFFDTEEDYNKVAHFLLSPIAVGLLLFVVVLIGFVMTWYIRKQERKRSGLRKKLDVAAPYMPVCIELSSIERDVW